jgi:hypothetical protein
VIIAVETNSHSWKPRDLPRKGEIWLRLESGMLYEMRERDPAGQWRACHRVGAPEFDYEPDTTVHCACWDSAVRMGEWVRVFNCPTQKEGGL